jgi:EmrB/QacA subfamily drug resistance transporter
MPEPNHTSGAAPGVAAGGVVLVTLCAGQFLMTLDSSVMNVSIATVASDVGTTVSGIQEAITFYTLVMAALMITGGKIGGIIGRKRAFSIGCVIYGCGSFVTALAPSLTVLILGWSVLEGVGAALIMPAIVALVAANFSRDKRSGAYGLVAAAGAIAIAVGPLIGGVATTYFSWRWVFAGEVIVVLVILVLARRMADTPVTERVRLDYVGSVLSASGLSLMVFAVLRSGTWGWVAPKAGAPSWFGISPVVWLFVGGLGVVWLFFRWETRVASRGGDPLLDPTIFASSQLTGGLTMFFFQYLVQMGVFFTVPLYLSVVLGLTALETGVRLLPLSVTLLLGAVGIPKLAPNVSPRLVVRVGVLALLAGTVVLLAALEPDSGAEIVLVPMLLIGFGMGALASQLGNVTVSAVADDRAPEVGGIQNTVTNLGASFGTALAGSLLIAALTTSFLGNIENNPAVPDAVVNQASVQLAAGVPFLSDADATKALESAGVDAATTDAVLEANADARLDGLKAALAVLALGAVISLFFTQRIPASQPHAVAT